MLTVDLDEEPDHLRGSAFFFDDRPELPGVLAHIATPDKSSSQHLTLSLQPLNRDGLLIGANDLASQYPDVQFPNTAEVDLTWGTDGLKVEFQTEVGTSAEGLLWGSSAAEASTIEVLAEVQSWNDFKNLAANLRPGQFIYRGQPCVNRLRTGFHRSARKDLVKYLGVDVPYLHRNLTPITRHLFRIDDGFEMGAFYNLIQHHGYPTPLLDWTASPFIAAFFALRRVDPGCETVRIFIFDRNLWCTTYRQYNRLSYLPPHISIIELLGLENDRMVPQQALSMLTNVDDIEFFVQHHERLSGKKFLTAIDLPVSERHRALDELSMMGITAASLFPGLDGACEAARGRMFGH